jgi:cytosine/adenosine deaminase-related metal-dependent hydrolase
VIRYHARLVAPVAGPPLRDATVAVDGSMIAYVGPRGAAPPGTDRELGEVVLVPGLVDAASDIGPDRGLAAGITTYARAGTNALRELIAAGVRGVAWIEVLGALPDDRDASLAVLRGALAAFRSSQTDLVRLGVAIRSIADVHEELLVDACALALGAGVPLSIAAGESDDETAFLREASGPLAEALRARGADVERRAHSAVHLLAELGVAAAAQPLVVAGPALDESDVGLLAYYGCRAVVRAPHPSDPLAALVPTLLAQLLDAGVEVGLGTVPGARSLVGTLVMPPPTALALATLGGAQALGLADRIGTLEPGKQADMAAFGLRPDASYSLGEEARLVMVGGRELRSRRE